MRRFSAHAAERCDAGREVESEKFIARDLFWVREVYVHVGQAGDEIFSGAVDEVGKLVSDVFLAERDDSCDLSFFDVDGLRAKDCVASVHGDHVNVCDDQILGKKEVCEEA